MRVWLIYIRGEVLNINHLIADFKISFFENSFKKLYFNRVARINVEERCEFQCFGCNFVLATFKKSDYYKQYFSSQEL